MIPVRTVKFITRVINSKLIITRCEWVHCSLKMECCIYESSLERLDVLPI